MTQPKFACPKCGEYASKVVNSRTQPRTEVYKRRRECATCGGRYTTYESIDPTSYAQKKPAHHNI